MNKAILIVTACLFTFAVPAFAEAADAVSEQQSGQDIRELIQRYAQTSGEPVIIDPRVRGRVSVFDQSQNAMTMDDLSVVLAVHNFSFYRSGRYTVIVPTNVIKQMPVELLEADKSYLAGQNLMAVIEVKKNCPEQLVPMLRPLLPPTSHFAFSADGKAVLLTETYANIKRIERLIKRLDDALDNKHRC